jgi:uncharacterized membrane protein YphA (DoxX/SURF4 family)
MQQSFVMGAGGNGWAATAFIQEFKHYRLPDWLRDLVGILKLRLSLLLLIGIERKPFAVAGGLGIAFLMGCAFAMHLRVKNPLFRMLPCLTLLVLSTVIAWINHRLLNPWLSCRAAPRIGCRHEWQRSNSIRP